MNKRILLDPGHGGKDLGANYGKFIEKDMNLKVALAARDYLSNYNADVFLTRTGDTYTTIAQRTAQALALRADAVASIHHNATGDFPAGGSEVFYWYTDKKAKRLARDILNRFLALGQKSRGIKPSSLYNYDFGILRINSVNGIPAVLGEFAFIDSPIDTPFVDTDEKLKAEGEAYGKALVNFFGLKRKPGR